MILYCTRALKMTHCIWYVVISSWASVYLSDLNDLPVGPHSHGLTDPYTRAKGRFLPHRSSCVLIHASILHGCTLQDVLGNPCWFMQLPACHWSEQAACMWLHGTTLHPAWVKTIICMGVQISMSIWMRLLSWTWLLAGRIFITKQTYYVYMLSSMHILGTPWCRYKINNHAHAQELRHPGPADQDGRTPWT